MSHIVKVVRPKSTRDKNTFLWDRHLHEFERGKTSFVAVQALSSSLTIDFDAIFKEGVSFEVVTHNSDSVLDGVTTRWFAKIKKLCGYRVLAQYLGSPTTFWINLLSDEVHAMLDAANKDPQMKTVVYMPPPVMDEEFAKDREGFMKKIIQEQVSGEMTLSSLFEVKRAALYKPRFRVGQRLELLSYTNSTQVRVARIREICGRRMNVLVMKEDHPGPLPDAEDDRQAGHKGAQYWIDQGSFFIFPVGFAAINKYELVGKPDYIQHCKNISHAYKRGEPVPYEPEDVTFEDLAREPVDAEQWEKVDIGQKFELIDPLSQQFNSLHVASVLSKCRSDGYLIIGMDGPDQADESFPIHISNVYMFPVGYAEKNGLTLAPPDEFEGDFKWKKYLEKEGAQALPLDLFRPPPSEERMSMFKVGMRLEAADMCENQLICPANIKSIHGRVINVNFDGWDAEFDELYDIDSHDILPAGWCEFHGYLLQQPKME